MKNLGKKILVVTLFAIVVYAVLAFASDIRKLQHHLVTFAWPMFLGALALAFCNYLVRFAKWEFYLRRLRIGVHAPGTPYKPVPVVESFVIFLAGFSMSITPGKAGEVFKSALLSSARGVAVARSAPIVVADRLSDLLSLIVLVAIGSMAFAGYGWIALAALAMVGGVLLVVMWESLTMWMIDRIARMKVGARIAPKLREAYGALREVTTPAALILMTVVSIVAWALECTALWLILRGLGTPTSLSLAFFAYATATIAGAIAMLPGGLGGTEATMQKILSTLGGVQTAAAGAATLLVRLATLWFAVALGYLALIVFRRRFDRNVPAAADVAPSQAAAPAHEPSA